MSLEDRQKFKLKMLHRYEDALEVRLAGIKAAKEVIKETHYEVTIKAAIGSLDNKNCSNNNIFNLIAYKPIFNLSNDITLTFASELTKISAISLPIIPVPPVIRQFLYFKNFLMF